MNDHAEATALARQLHDPAFLAGALARAAQPFITAQSFDEAAARLDEARTVGSLDVAGMAESPAAEIGAARDSFHDQHLAALEQRIGPAVSFSFGQPTRTACECEPATSSAPFRRRA